jgi:hypothetical protein
MPRRKTKFFPGQAKDWPILVPSWRWDRATWLVDNNKPATLKRDGVLIQRATKYIRGARRDFRSWRDQLVLKNDPLLHDVFEFRNQNMLQAMELRCRLIAGEAPGVIAIKMSYRKEFVELYGDLFFDVRHRLESTSFIHFNAIGLRPCAPATGEQLMLLSIYNHGPEFIDAWIRWWPDQGVPGDLSTREGRSHEAIELFCLAQNLPNDAKSQKLLLKNMPLIGKLAPQMFQRRRAHQVLAKSNAEWLSKLNWKPNFEHQNDPDIPPNTNEKDDRQLKGSSADTRLPLAV